MAGAKTRFGFQGGSDPPDDKESRSARTVFGHDIHLQLPHGLSPPRPPGSPTPLPPPPAGRPSATATGAAMPDSDVPDAASTECRGRPRPSRLARFLGRWSRSGRFEAKSRMRMEDHRAAPEDDIEVPRDTTGRNVVLVVLAALLAFGITFAAVKIRHRMSTPTPAPPAQPAAPPTAAPGPIPAPPPSALPASAVAAPAAPAPARAAPTLDPAAKGLGAPTPAARKPAPKTHFRAEPPTHLKGELLPIGR